MSAHVASLGMYDHPAQRAANDALWQAVALTLRAAGVDVPDMLDRTRPVEEIWRDPNLLLAQACGYPLVADTGLALRVVAVPSYAVPGCADMQHASHIVVRADDAGIHTLGDVVGRRAAINAPLSNSGYNLFRAAIAQHAVGGRAFSTVVETGAHRASALAVRDGVADVAAIDAVTWAALARFEPEAVLGLRILAQTGSSPALPFVTASGTDPAIVAALRHALVAAVQAPALRAARAALFLSGITPAGNRRFTGVRDIARGAAEAGYPTLQ